MADDLPEPVTVPLWEDVPPGEIDVADTAEVVEDFRYSNIHTPQISFYLPAPERNNGITVVIFPGGGYRLLAMGHEGFDVAERLNQAGFIACIVKYRVAPYHRPIPQMDAARAMAIARQRAEDLGGDPQRVGVLGFSAGGHLAGSLCVLPGKPGVFPDGKAMPESARPDFAVLIYPVVSMLDEVGHTGSRDQLLGDDPVDQEIQLYSLDLQVDAHTPPVFLVHAADDHVSVENSERMFKALKDAGVKTEFLRLESGGHGFGLGPNNPVTSHWPDRAIEWINQLYKAQPDPQPQETDTGTNTKAKP